MRSASSCAATSRSIYGQVMQVMGRISGAGFKKVALVTEQER